MKGYLIGNLCKSDAVGVANGRMVVCHSAAVPEPPGSPLYSLLNWRTADAVTQILYPDYGSPNYVRSPGIYIAVKDRDQPICPHEMEHNYPVGEPISVDARYFLEGTAVHVVESHRASIHLKTQTFVHPELDVCVRAFQAFSNRPNRGVFDFYPYCALNIRSSKDEQSVYWDNKIGAFIWKGDTDRRTPYAVVGMKPKPE